MTDELEPYEQLASTFEYELMLVAERRFDELEELRRRRDGVRATLPEVPPDAARPVLERCALLHKRVEIELLRVREAVLLELAGVRQAQRAANGYAPVRTTGPRVVAQA